MNKNNQEAKHDEGKLEISLVPPQIIRDIAEVRMFGTEKYQDPENWKRVEKKRYVDALMRHLLAYIDDPDGVDEESGIPHYKHAACNMAFICELEGKWYSFRQNGPTAELEKLQKELRECKNELCLRCGMYKTKHLGSCEECRWENV